MLTFHRKSDFFNISPRPFGEIASIASDSLHHTATAHGPYSQAHRHACRHRPNLVRVRPT